MIDTKELQEVDFGTTFRGYDKKEVDLFIEDVVDRITEQNSELEKLKTDYDELLGRFNGAQSRLDEQKAFYEKKFDLLNKEFNRRKASGAADGVKPSPEISAPDIDALREKTKKQAQEYFLSAKKYAAKLIYAAKKKADGILTEAQTDAARITAEANENYGLTESVRASYESLRGSALTFSHDVVRILSEQVDEFVSFSKAVENSEFPHDFDGARAVNILREKKSAGAENRASADSFKYSEDEIFPEGDRHNGENNG